MIHLNLSKCKEIPKIIHISWPNKEILSNQSTMILNGIANMKKINPEYKIIISDDKDIEKYIQNKISVNNYKLIDNKKK